MFNKKTWKDRIAEFITRRTLTYENGTTAIVTVERNEGEVSQTGDAFSASNMNDLEDRVSDEFRIIEADAATKCTISFPSNGSIVKTLEDDSVLTTTFPNDGSIVQTLTDSEGNVLATRTTTFPSNGTIVVQ